MQSLLTLLVKIALADEGGDVLLCVVLFGEGIVLLNLGVESAHDTSLELVFLGSAVVDVGHATRDLRRCSERLRDSPRLEALTERRLLVRVGVDLKRWLLLSRSSLSQAAPNRRPRAKRTDDAPSRNDGSAPTPDKVVEFLVQLHDIRPTRPLELAALVIDYVLLTRALSVIYVAVIV